MDRRHFLSTSMMAAAAFAAPAAEGVCATLPAALAPASAPAAAALSEARFRSILGSQFLFTGAEWRGSLRLTEVVGRSSDTRLEQFTAVFRSDAAARPAPGIYDVDHAEWGRLMLHIDGCPDSDERLATFALLRG